MEPGKLPPPAPLPLILASLNKLTMSALQVPSMVLKITQKNVKHSTLRFRHTDMANRLYCFVV